MKTRILPLLLLLAPMLRAQTAIDFDQANYIALRGESVTVTLTFDQPVPNGLDTYALRLNHPEGVVDPLQTVLTVVPELDHFLIDDSAVRTVTAAHAEIRGMVEFQNPLVFYHGTDFLTIQLTLAADAPLGTHALTLSIPAANSFVDGDLNVLDGGLILGTATLNIVPFIDLNTNNVPDTWELEFYPTLDDVPASVTIDNVEMTIEEMYIANLDPTGDQIPKFDTPTTFATVVGRVYDVYHNPDLTDELGWVLVDTHHGTGTPYEITDLLEGFYKFEVRLPEED